MFWNREVPLNFVSSKWRILIIASTFFHHHLLHPTQLRGLLLCHWNVPKLIIIIITHLDTKSVAHDVLSNHKKET